jgi:hypothetical protein
VVCWSAPEHMRNGHHDSGHSGPTMDLLPSSRRKPRTAKLRESAIFSEPRKLPVTSSQPSVTSSRNSVTSHVTSPRPSVTSSRPPEKSSRLLEDVWSHGDGALPPPTASPRPLFEAQIKDDIFLTELPPSPAVSTLTSRSTTRNLEAPRTVKFRLRNGLDTELGADNNSCSKTASPKLRSWTRLRKDRSPASKEAALEEQSKMNIWRSEVRRPKNSGLCLEEDDRRKRKDEGKEEEDEYKLDEEMVMRVEEEDDRKEAEEELEVQRPRPRRRKEADALVPRDWKQVPTDIVC